MTGTARNRSVATDERGIALVLALFMVMAMSVLGVSLMFMSQSETWSSANYKLAAQARYGAESGVQRAANFLLNCPAAPAPCIGNADPNLYVEPGDNPADPLANYDTTGPVVRTLNSVPVVLSSNPAVPSNYPVQAVQDAFSQRTQGSLVLDGSPVNYRTSAQLLSMRQYPETMAGNALRTIQTWEITSVGTIAVGPRSSQVEVSAVIERALVPTYRYAAFARHDGCSALSFGGGVGTDSYDSSAPLVSGRPVVAQSNSNVGTNGNLSMNGNVLINGTLSTPRSGVGACNANNVTAQTISGQGTVTGGLVQLAQAVNYPTPTLAATPPTTSTTLSNNNCGGLNAITNRVTCNTSGSSVRLAPVDPTQAVVIGNLQLNNNQTLRLATGTYVLNSLTTNSQSEIQIEAGATVTIQIAGNGVSTPLDMRAGSFINSQGFDPSRVQITYGGTGSINLRGHANTAALIYAPNASTEFIGGGDLYGALITRTLRDFGNVMIHYDRRLQNAALTSGEPMMSSFTWKSF